MIPNVTGDSLPGPLSDEKAKSEQSMDSWSRVGFSFLSLWAAAKGRRPPSSSLPLSDLLSPSVFLRGCVFSLAVRALCVWEYVRVLNILVRSFHIFLWIM